MSNENEKVKVYNLLPIPLWFLIFLLIIIITVVWSAAANALDCASVCDPISKIKSSPNPGIKLDSDDLNSFIQSCMNTCELGSDHKIADLCEKNCLPSFTLNGNVKKFAYLLAGQSAMQAAANGLQAGLAMDQYNNLDNFKVNPTPTAIGGNSIQSEAMVEKCKLNPKLPECSVNLGGSGTVGFGGQGELQINAGGASNVGSAEAVNSDGNGSANAMGIKGKASPDALNGSTGEGATLGQGSDNQFEGGPVAAAEVKTKQMGGGGGGGGGAGSIGAPSTGNGGGGGGDSRQNSGSDGAGHLAFANPKGGVSFSNSGGGRGGGKENSNENIFGNLLGKKEDGTKGQILDIKNAAEGSKGIGDVGTSLWTRISKTIKKVDERGQLIKYVEKTSK